MKLLNTTLLVFSVALTIIVLLLVSGQITALREYHDTLSEQLKLNGAAVSVEPYGGCDEAWQAPHSDGAKWCEANGFIVPSR